MASWLPSPSAARHIFYGILIGFSLSLSSTSLALYYHNKRREDAEKAVESVPRPIELRSDEILDGVTGLIGMNLIVAGVLDTTLKMFWVPYSVFPLPIIFCC